MSTGFKLTCIFLGTVWTFRYFLSKWLTKAFYRFKQSRYQRRNQQER
jgi:hypothetical protein